jgi:hypothetical protein
MIVRNARRVDIACVPQQMVKTWVKDDIAFVYPIPCCVFDWTSRMAYVGELTSIVTRHAVSASIAAEADVVSTIADNVFVSVKAFSVSSIIEDRLR